MFQLFIKSMKVVSSGLDVLESIGKRTYDVLTEGDHGLKKVIELNRQNKPNLSQVRIIVFLLNQSESHKGSNIK